ncbi:MAG: epoxyqueuosine reductase [Chloroflexi bacterium]|nr:epoxyqueuosine reductase [Chloroflexota bacterium]
MSPDSLAVWVAGLIQQFCSGPKNRLGPGWAERAWGDPLVGFSRGDDPLYHEFKEAVGPFHWTPAEAFGLAFPDEAACPEELTVIAWALPQTEAAKADNRGEVFYPAERWARSRMFGEEVNVRLRGLVVQAFSAAGIPTVAPTLLPQWGRRDSGRFGFASTWSDRHAAHACGLGTFGLCDGLITPLGKAVRLGSVVARVQIPPTPRPYGDPRAWCLFFARGVCGECIARCPVGAISERGHDKERCSRHLRPTVYDYVQATWGFEGYGCGLCQTGVPCESGIPSGLQR